MFFAIANTMLAAGASIAYGWQGDLRHCIYWGAVVVITLTVTL
jgi:hypothetical protein